MENIFEEFENTKSEELEYGYDAVYKADYFKYSQMEVKKLEWIWEPYIVRGNLNIIVGEGGVGKSYFTTWLLSAISKGEKVPFKDNNFSISNSILQNAEDDIGATILPRLLSNNADTDKIAFFNEIYEVFSIDDIDKLDKVLYELRPSIMVLDPIQAYIGNTNMNSAVEVRNVLKPLRELAERYNCAIVMLMHMNKNTGTNKATNRVMGSYDFIACCRSAILIENNPENPQEKLFIPIKTNLMKENEKNALSFKISDEGKIEWLENKGRINPDEILLQNNNIFDKNSSAKGFILGALSRGELSSEGLKDLVVNKGKISEKTYNITKASLRKEDTIINYQRDNKFYWSLNNEK